ncbi:MAG: endonuclease III [Nitrospirae bacterium]|nr:endonuclease III [Nitrospirota bacterium]MBF0592483.1 endonuclease III [Nitrospirota bacterium]
MKDFDIAIVISILQEQVSTLKVPYIEFMAVNERVPYKVLISCILSLRTQDRTTALASERLFGLADTPEAVCKLSVEEVERAIYPVGFYRVKAVNIKAISQRLLDDYGGVVPDTIEELLTFKGVGRKTANLVVTVGYGKDGICVDTHVHRITNRWGYVQTKTPTQTEFTLREILPRQYWRAINGLLVSFGQGICRPVSPLCARCSIRQYCEFGRRT